jgi:hypothetical protein
MPQTPYFPPNIELAGPLATLTAASTGTYTTTQNTTAGANGVMVRLYVSAATGTTPTVTLNVQGYDPSSAQYFTIATSGAFSVAAAGFYTLTVYPGIAAGASPNVGANAVVPVNWRISYTIGGTTPAVTGTIGVMTITP